MANEQTLSVVIHAEDRFSKTLVSIDKQLAQNLRNLRNGMLLVGGVVTGFSLLAVNAAVRQQAAIGQLDRALQAHNDTYAANKDAIDKAVDSLYKYSKFSRGELLAAVTGAVDKFGNLTLALTALPVAVDLAAGTGKTLADSMDLITRAMTGDGGAINQLDQLGVKAYLARTPLQLLTLIQERFAGSARESLTPMDELKKSFESISLAIGTALLPALQAVIEPIVRMSESFARFVKDHPLLAKVVGDITLALAALAIVMGTAITLLLGIAGAVVAVELAGAPLLVIIIAVEAALILLGIALYELYAHWGTVWNGMKAITAIVVNEILDGVELLVDGVIGGVNAIIGSVNRVTGILKIPAIPKVPELSLPRLDLGLYGASGAGSNSYSPISGTPGGASAVVSATANPSPTTVLNFNAPIYGMDDFNKQVTQAVSQAASRGGFDSIFKK